MATFHTHKLRVPHAEGARWHNLRDRASLSSVRVCIRRHLRVACTGTRAIAVLDQGLRLAERDLVIFMNASVSSRGMKVKTAVDMSTRQNCVKRLCDRMCSITKIACEQPDRPTLQNKKKPALHQTSISLGTLKCDVLGNPTDLKHIALMQSLDPRVRTYRA